MNPPSLALILFLLLTVCGCGPQQFAFKDVEKDLDTRLTQMQDLERARPKLEKQLEELKQSVPEAKHPSSTELQNEPVDHYESRFGIGFPWMMNDEHYSAKEKSRLEALQNQIQALGPKLEPVFRLEADIKVWQRSASSSK